MSNAKKPGRPAGVTKKKNKMVFTTTIAPETAARLQIIAARLCEREGVAVSRGDVIDRLVKNARKALQ